MKNLPTPSTYFSARTRAWLFLWAQGALALGHGVFAATNAPPEMPMLHWRTPAGAEVGATWSARTNGNFIFCLAADERGGFWVGTEGNGLWHFDPAALPERRWEHATTRDGLAEDDVLSLKLDRCGRLWAGHTSRGVSVFNGQQWRSFSTVTGPLSGRVSDIQNDPAGNVWLATDTGIAIYQPATERWSYLTNRNGLPANQVQALAFDGAGHVFIAMQTEGLVVGTWSDARGFALLRHVPGATRLEVVPSDKTLPSRLPNTLLVTRDGALWVGTPDGLAVTRDLGVTWSIRHGRNFGNKLKGRYLTPEEKNAASTNSAPVESPAPLTDDWISCLAEDAEGHVWVGYRQGLCQVLDPRTLTSLQTATDEVSTNLPKSQRAPYVRAILLGEQCGPLLALYNGGLMQNPGSASAPPLPARPALATVPALPAPAAPPTQAAVHSLAQTCLNAEGQLEPGAAVFFGTDWQTKGDWLGKWGQQFAELFSHNLANFSVALSDKHDTGYKIKYAAGPTGAEHGYSYLPDYSETFPGALYNPYLGCRALAEVNDGSFSRHALEEEGPDLWMRLNLEHKGLHRISLYFCNLDAHSGRNHLRDYLVAVHKTADRQQVPDLHGPLQAQGRVRDFFGGVYVQFLVCGPATYHVRVARNYSFVAKLHGVFLDKLSGTPTVHEFSPYAPGLADIYYGPLDAELLPRTGAQPAPLLAAAQELWDALHTHAGKPQVAAFDHEARLLAYRAAVAAGAHPELLRAWRWQMNLWEASDQRALIEAARLGWESYTFDKKNAAHEPLHRIWDTSKTKPAGAGRRGE